MWRPSWRRATGRPGSEHQPSEGKSRRPGAAQILIHYVEHGNGVPLVALHGAGVDHREIEAALEAIGPGAGYRRIYPDLPGMGRSTSDGLTGNDEVVTVLGRLHRTDRRRAGPAARAFVRRVPGSRRGRAATGRGARPGVAVPGCRASHNVPDHDVVRQDADAYDELEPAQRAGFDEYFVVRTPATARRYRDHVCRARPSSTRPRCGASSPAGRSTSAGPFAAPTLIAAGRRDSSSGTPTRRPARALSARHAGRDRGRRARAHARTSRTARRARRRLARSSPRALADRLVAEFIAPGIPGSEIRLRATRLTRPRTRRPARPTA